MFCFPAISCLVHVYVINIFQVILLHFWSQSFGLGVMIYVLTLYKYRTFVSDGESAYN